MNTIILSLILLGLTEAILKPVVTNLFKLGIKKYLVPAYDKLDALLLVPDNWQHFVDDAEEFLYKSVLPEDIEPTVAEKVVKEVVNNFDLKTFLAKSAVEALR